MNTQEATKHRTVIKWWIENLDKGVWRKDLTIKEATWRLSKAPEFSLFSMYVQNDEYAELRKAKADD